MASHDPNHIFRKNVWASYGATQSHASTGPITPVSQRDPNHIFRAHFWDSYGLQGQGTSAGGSGSGGKKKATAKKGKHVKYSRHMIAAAALRDAWGHKAQAGGQG